MPLISAANLQAFTDHPAAVWDAVRPAFGSTADVPAVAGTVRNLLSLLLTVPVGSNDIDVEGDLDASVYNVLQQTGAEPACGWLQPALQALNSHCSKRGPAVNAAVTGLTGYLNYLNTTPTGAPYAALLAPGYQDLYRAVQNVTLPPQSVFHRAISPDAPWTSFSGGPYANGLGSRAVGGAFVAGAAPNLALYAEVTPLAVVTADFASGTAPATVTVTGTDNLGNAAATWTLTLDSNNPVSAVSTTVTPAATAQARQTFAVASASGVVPGSLLKVNAGLPDQETVLVEAVAGSNLTAVFQLAHLAGATLTGKRTYALTATAGPRCRAVSAVTIGVTGHTAGAVRIDGRQDRVAV